MKCDYRTHGNIKAHYISFRFQQETKLSLGLYQEGHLV